MIPEGWKKLTVGTALKIKNNLRKPLSAQERGLMKGEYPYYGPTKVQDWINEFSYEGRYVLIGEDGDHFLKFRVNQMTQIVEGKFNVNNHAHVIGSSNICSVDWFHCFFQNRDISAFLTRQGAKRYKLNKAALEVIPILVPPLPEQRRIAEILSTWDRAIEVTEKLIANSEAQKKALMQKLLTGRERLPGFEGEWQRILLGDAFSERVERNSGELELLSVSQSKGVIRQEEAGRRNISSADTAKYKIVRVGDIAYNTMRMWQGASALSSLNGIVSPAYTILKPHTNQSSKFYSYLFKLPKIIHIFERHSQGLVSDTWNLKYPIFSKIWAYVPKYDEQKAIARVLVTCDEKLKAETLHLRHLQSQKSALMQQLLTGKRRVKIDKEAAA